LQRGVGGGVKSDLESTVASAAPLTNTTYQTFALATSHKTVCKEEGITLRDVIPIKLRS
jgi:hypothetical protein